MNNMNMSGGKSCCGGHCVVSKIAKYLLVIGGLNWGLVGVATLMNNGADWNIVHAALGSMPTLEAIVYVLVGVAAIVKMFGCRCKKCMSMCSADNKTEGQM